MTFSRNIKARATVLHSFFRKILLVGVAISSSGSLLADPPVQARINHAVALTLGDHPVLLAVGTVVTVLHQQGINAVVSFKLPDGSPVIVQIPTSSLSTVSLPNAAVPSRVLTSANSVPPSTVQETTTLISTQSSSSDDSAAGPTSDPNPVQIRPASSVTFSYEDIALPFPKFTALNGSFYITIDGQPVLVVYSLPIEDEHLAKSASNLIFYGPYPSEKTDLKGNIIPDIVTRLGCAVFSFSFSVGEDQLSDPTTAYWSKDSKWFAAVMSAREEIIKEFALDRKKLLLMGYSGGGGMVLNLAGAYPDQVDAVAAQGANLSPELTTKNSVSWLIVNNRGETNASVTIPFYKHLKELGCSALYCETTPERGRGDYHSPSGQAFDLIYTFLAGILEQRKLLQDGTQDLSKLWPYAADSNPLKRYAVIRTLDLSDPATASDHYDLLPSAAFASNWCKVCPPIQTVSFFDTGNPARLHVNFPASDKPVGVLLYYDRPAYQNVARQVEDISALAEHGCMVISPSFGMSPERFAQAASEWIISQDNLASIPIHLAGYGEEGARFLATMTDETRLSCKSVTLVGLDTFPLPRDIGDKIESLAKGCGLYSFFNCRKTIAPTPLDALSQDLVSNESRARGCQNLIVSGEDHSDDAKIKIEQQALNVIKQTVDTARGNLVSAEPAIWLENPVLPEQPTANNEVDITVNVRDRGIYGQQGTIQLKSLNIVLATAHLSFNFDGEQQITLSYIPTQSGEVPLEIVLPSFPQESSLGNNRLTTKLVVK